MHDKFYKSTKITAWSSHSWETDRFQSTPNIVFLENHIHTLVSQTIYFLQIFRPKFYMYATPILFHACYIFHEGEDELRISHYAIFWIVLLLHTVVPVSIPLSTLLSSTLSIYYFLRFCLNGTSFHAIYGVLYGVIVCL